MARLMATARQTWLCRECGLPFTVDVFGVLNGSGSMVSTIPTDETLELHPDCFTLGDE